MTSPPEIKWDSLYSVNKVQTLSMCSSVPSNTPRIWAHCHSMKLESRCSPAVRTTRSMSATPDVLSCAASAASSMLCGSRLPSCTASARALSLSRRCDSSGRQNPCDEIWGSVLRLYEVCHQRLVIIVESDNTRLLCNETGACILRHTALISTVA